MDRSGRAVVATRSVALDLTTKVGRSGPQGAPGRTVQVLEIARAGTHNGEPRAARVAPGLRGAVGFSARFSSPCFLCVAPRLRRATFAALDIAICSGSRRWPREESNLRPQIRSLPLYPLSYGALQGVCPRRAATSRPTPRARLPASPAHGRRAPGRPWDRTRFPRGASDR